QSLEREGADYGQCGFGRSGDGRAPGGHRALRGGTGDPGGGHIGPIRLHFRADQSGGGVGRFLHCAGTVGPGDWEIQGGIWGMKRNLIRIVIMIVVVGIAIVTAGAIIRARSGKDQKVEIKTAKVERMDVKSTVSATGVLQAYKTVDVKSNVSGKVMKLL